MNTGTAEIIIHKMKSKKDTTRNIKLRVPGGKGEGREGEERGGERRGRAREKEPQTPLGGPGGGEGTPDPTGRPDGLLTLQGFVHSVNRCSTLRGRCTFRPKDTIGFSRLDSFLT